MQSLLNAVISLGALGLILGGLLGYAAKVFAVPTDERADAIKEILPGANCGACGFPGCNALAEAIAKGEAAFISCPVGGAAVAQKIAQIMGVEEDMEAGAELAPPKAKLICRGGKAECKQIAEYDGLPDCRAANMYASGGRACNYACLGFGNCARVCPFGAITMNADRLPEIDPEKCTACGKCIEACPKAVLTLIPGTAQVYVVCNSQAPGKKVTKVCSEGCIACRICEQACPFNAIKVINNLAVIDYEKCRVCGLCAEKCPRHVIIDQRLEKPKANIDPNKCIGCTICKKSCPVEAINGEVKEAHTADPNICISCGLCAEKCPKGAITMKVFGN
ncbi:MAG: RnfABCDGE type electron transport complex subunit B [bacterium]